MHTTRKLWTWLAAICVLSFAVLGWVGTEICLAAPPIPKQVIGSNGKVLFTEGQVQRGQEAWLSAGGQQLGTVWGHGSYVAPDWSADWLHREATALREIWAQRDYGKRFDQLEVRQQAELNGLLKSEMRRNSYDAKSGTITLSPERAEAVQQVTQHYVGLFGNDPTLDKLREQYAMNAGSLPDPQDLQALPAFVFLVGLGGSHRPSRCKRPELHQQLAARNPGRQYADHRRRHLVDRQRHPDDRRHRRHDFLPFHPQGRGRSGSAQGRPAVQPHPDAVDEGDAEILLCGHRPDVGANRHGGHHRALRGRGA